MCPAVETRTRSGKTSHDGAFLSTDYVGEHEPTDDRTRTSLGDSTNAGPRTPCGGSADDGGAVYRRRREPRKSLRQRWETARNGGVSRYTPGIARAQILQRPSAFWMFRSRKQASGFGFYFARLSRRVRPASGRHEQPCGDSLEPSECDDYNTRGESNRILVADIHSCSERESRTDLP